MLTNNTDPISRLIPPVYLQLLSRAIGSGALALTAVITDDVMRQLNYGYPGLVLFPDGGAIVLITETMLRDAFAQEKP